VICRSPGTFVAIFCSSTFFEAVVGCGTTNTCLLPTLPVCEKPIEESDLMQFVNGVFSLYSTWMCDPQTTPEQKAQFLKSEYETIKKLVAGAGLGKPEYWAAQLDVLDKLDHVHKELVLEKLEQLKGKGLSQNFDIVGFWWLSKILEECFQLGVGRGQQGFCKQCEYLRVVEQLFEKMVTNGVEVGVFHADEGVKSLRVVGADPALSKDFTRDFRDALRGVSLWGFVKDILKARYETVAARPFYWMVKEIMGAGRSLESVSWNEPSRRMLLR
jgi:hypothetical protein